MWAAVALPVFITNANAAPADLEIPPAPAFPPPPAAHLVMHGIKSERVKKERELRIAELEDQNFQLKKPASSPAPKRVIKIGPIPIFWEDTGGHNPSNN